MAKISTIQVKFEGYDKTFSNINSIAEELTRLTDEVIASEKELAKADFGSDQWNELSKNIITNKKLIEEFGTTIESSGVASMQDLNKATQELIKSNDEFIKSQEDIAKNQEIVNDEFSSSKITEFGAKAAAAILGVAESVSLLSDSSRSAEELQKSFQQTVIVTNALKDSAEVLGDAQKKLKSITDLASSSFKNGASATQKLSVGMKALGTAIKGPLLIFTLLAGAVTFLISQFGGLQEVIDSVSDSVQGLVSAIKGLVSGDFDVFKNFSKGKDVNKLLRETNKELDRLAAKTSTASVEWAKYQAAADQATTVEAKRANLNKISEEKIALLKDEAAALTLIEINTKNLEEKRKIAAQLDAKEIEIQQLISENILTNRELTLEALNNEITKLEIKNQVAVDGLKEELKFASLNLDTRLKLIDSIANKETEALKERIRKLKELTFLNEAQTNELLQLQDDLRIKQKETEEAKRDEIFNTSNLISQKITEQTALEIERSEKALEFLSLRTQAGLDYYNKEVKRINDLKIKSIDALIAPFLAAQIQGIKLTEDEKIRFKQLQNEKAKLNQDTLDKQKAASITNLELIAEAERAQQEVNQELRATILEQFNIENEATIRLLERQQEKLTLQQQSWSAIFRIGKNIKQQYDLIKQTYDLRFKALQKERDEQLKLLDDKRKALQADKAILDAKEAAGTITDQERIALGKINEQLKNIDKEEVKVKIKFEADTAGLSQEELDKLKQAREDSFAAANQAVTDISDTLQTAFGLGVQIIDLQTAALDAKLSAIDEKRQAIDDKLEQLNAAIAQTETEISTLNTLIQDSEGSRRAFLIEGLEREQSTRDDLAEKIEKEEQLKKGLAEEEKRINKQKEEQQKKADRLNRISTAIAAIATAVQAGLAVAKTAGETGTASPIFVPLTIAAIAAGIGAVTAIVGSVQKFADGGELKGPSHDNGGIRGTGRFNNIEVEGGEFIVNKESTRNNRSLLEAINKQGRFKQFANGGELEPNILAINQVVSNTKTVSAIESLSKVQPQIAIVDIITGINRVDIINTNTKIG